MAKFFDDSRVSELWAKIKTVLGLKMDKAIYDPTNKAQDVFAYAPAREETVMLRRVAAALPSYADWYSVTYGVGKFVAVADTNKAAYSTDGINWSETTLPSLSSWYSVTYGVGKFVAVAWDGDKAAYSTDGINWSETTLPSLSSWASVTYGNGKFVAVASSSNKAIYSLDGITWSAATMPSSADWQAVVYSDGKFIAIAYNTNKAAYSADGINWSAATLPSSASWHSVTYGSGKFVAVAYGYDKAAYSADGITWTAATLPSSASWHSVTYGNGKFVAVAGNRSNKAAYSTDGINWTAATLPSFSSWFSTTYGNGKFVAVADALNNKVAYSFDGITWYDTCTYYVDSTGNELSGFDSGPLSAADVGALPESGIVSQPGTPTSPDTILWVDTDDDTPALELDTIKAAAENAQISATNAMTRANDAYMRANQAIEGGSTTAGIVETINDNIINNINPAISNLKLPYVGTVLSSSSARVVGNFVNTQYQAYLSCVITLTGNVEADGLVCYFNIDSALLYPDFTLLSELVPCVIVSSPSNVSCRMLIASAYHNGNNWTVDISTAQSLASGTTICISAIIPYQKWSS